VLARERPRAALLELAARCDRAVLLGDALELRHGPMREALDAAHPFLRDLGAALGAGKEVVLVPGNHDHGLLRGWLERRALDADGASVGLQAEVEPAEGEPLAALLEWLEPARPRVFYPGVWLRDDVYAIHGHYLDRHITVPILERLGAGLMARLVHEPPDGLAGAEDYERTLAPMYAWIDAVAQSGIRGRGGGLQIRAWQTLQGSRRPRGLRGAGLRIGFPTAVWAMNRAGLGPLRHDISGPVLRRSALVAFGEVLGRLGVGAAHAIFGHTHRAGPLPGDAETEWSSPSGTRLLNTGCWLTGQEAMGGTASRSPYRPGFCVVVEAQGPPQLVNLLAPD
jgi:hypothetical protein